MDLQVDETIAVIAHQALMLHRAMSADAKPEPKAVIQHIQRMQGTALTWAQQTLPQEPKVEPEPPAEARGTAHTITIPETLKVDLGTKPAKPPRDKYRRSRRAA